MGHRELDFSPLQPRDGFASWQQERAAWLEEQARKRGLPLGRNAEVRFKDGRCVSGLLRLSTLAGRDYEVGATAFTLIEVEAFVRLH